MLGPYYSVPSINGIIVHKPNVPGILYKSYSYTWYRNDTGGNISLQDTNTLEMKINDISLQISVIFISKKVQPHVAGGDPNLWMLPGECTQLVGLRS